MYIAHRVYTVHTAQIFWSKTLWGGCWQHSVGHTVSVKYMTNCSETSPVTILTPKCQRWLRGKSDNLYIFIYLLLCPLPLALSESGTRDSRVRICTSQEARCAFISFRGQVWFYTYQQPGEDLHLRDNVLVYTFQWSCVNWHLLETMSRFTPIRNQVGINISWRQGINSDLSKKCMSNYILTYSVKNIDWGKECNK